MGVVSCTSNPIIVKSIESIKNLLKASRIMPMNTKHKMKSGHRQSGNRDSSREVPSKSIVYRGPIRTKAETVNASLHTVTLSLTGTVTSDSGGAIVPLAFSSDPTGASNWSSFANCFDEYRTLAMSVQYWPNDRYDPGLTQHQRPIATVVDHNGSAAMSSYAQAAGFESFEMKSTGDPWGRKAFMNGIGEAEFNNTSGSPADAYYVKLYASNLGISSEYGRYMVLWRVQFRGHGI